MEMLSAANGCLRYFNSIFRWLFPTTFIVFIHIHACFYVHSGAFQIPYTFLKNGVSKSWDILCHIELRREVFPKHLWESYVYLFGCCLFLLATRLREKPSDWELEGPENLRVLCQERASGGWNLCLDFLAINEDSNNSSQESFEVKLRSYMKNTIRVDC